MRMLQVGDDMILLCKYENLINNMKAEVILFVIKFSCKFVRLWIMSVVSCHKKITDL
jgi:hypothetical protein